MSKKNPLRAYRNAKGMTLKEFSAILQISVPRLGRWETDALIPAEKLARISKVTGISRQKLRPDLYRGL